MNESQLSGLSKTTGNYVFQAPVTEFDRGIILSPQPHISPQDRWVSKYSGNPTTVSVIENSDEAPYSLPESVWKKRRVRDNQKGLKASESTHGQEWFPVSNTMIEEEVDEDIEGATVNIQSTAFQNGLAVQAPRLGRDLKATKRILLRNKDLLYTSSKVRGEQNIIEPGGRAAGLNGILFGKIGL